MHMCHGVGPSERGTCCPGVVPEMIRCVLGYRLAAGSVRLFPPVKRSEGAHRAGVLSFSVRSSGAC